LFYFNIKAKKLQLNNSLKQKFPTRKNSRIHAKSNRRLQEATDACKKQPTPAKSNRRLQKTTDAWRFAGLTGASLLLR
jgi:hypothetical protein